MQIWFYVAFWTVRVIPPGLCYVVLELCQVGMELDSHTCTRSTRFMAACAVEYGRHPSCGLSHGAVWASIDTCQRSSRV